PYTQVYSPPLSASLSHLWSMAQHNAYLSVQHDAALLILITGCMGLISCQPHLPPTLPFAPPYLRLAHFSFPFGNFYPQCSSPSHTLRFPLTPHHLFFSNLKNLTKSRSHTLRRLILTPLHHFALPTPPSLHRTHQHQQTQGMQYLSTLLQISIFPFFKIYRKR
ncbi:hypothetical protein, partial [Bartonella sp. MM73XJBT]|uniref:hypothetical protein n=1 Tax=Bartonella sp. MM73XJBT TaxID=3019095 RepID=UPI002362BCB6